MSRIKALLIAVLAALTIGAISASAASAHGTVTGNINESSVPIDCDFTADYVGTNVSTDDPPSDVTILGNTIVLTPATNCDPNTINSISDIDLEFDDLGSPDNWQATLHPFTVNAQIPILGACNFTTTGDILTSLPGPSNALGAYSGTGTASPSGFFCQAAGDRTLNVDDVTFAPTPPEEE